MRSVLTALVLGLGAAAGRAQETTTAKPGGEAAPDLPVAEWGRHGTISLEDFRGQLTAVVFYDDKSS
ncbi:MAG TPA: hypothetical protein VEJ18_14880 [Planctomycetota bacterium]|nr:hypothetical protein [Planctomycetota bacterium]